MRCKACNVELNDFESTRKDSNDEYIDMCMECLTASIDERYEDESDFVSWAEVVYIPKVIDENFD